tara:strand:+ start:1554 stop:1757 length:204 start_codon:yes stop_codon:yes gene_type:complete
VIILEPRDANPKSSGVAPALEGIVGLLDDHGFGDAGLGSGVQPGGGGGVGGGVGSCSYRGVTGSGFQ